MNIDREIQIKEKGMEGEEMNEYGYYNVVHAVVMIYEHHRCMK